MVSVYFGFPRSGKTTLIAKLSYQYFSKGIPVYSNVNVSGTLKVTKSNLTLNNFPEGSVILWDESGIDFNNRKFKSMTDDMIEFIKMHGHQKINVIFFSQSWDDCDITIRRVAENLALISRVGPFSLIRYIGRRFSINKDTGDLQCGYRWYSLIYWLFYPFLKIKPTGIIYRPFYYHMFNSYSKTDKPLINDVKWNMNYKNQNKYINLIKYKIKDFKSLSLKGWIFRILKYIYILFFIYVLFKIF